KPKSTWILLKPHIDSLLANFAFPQLIFIASKPAMWEADPLEYARASVGSLPGLSPVICACVSHAKDEYETFSSPGSDATSFLLCLASNRTKMDFPMPQFINTILRS
ncbi:hypothetical protein CY34DRAFT_37831, partial [Suillus luteus UH-Slu-Lm8-n1]